ncbi:probable protein phosphatase 2c 25 [Phtheirospermum japonicum]|uniref:protein-serine/threonine phosphatase n=1 Tax=Phtheirospermum japonicum TaxID=374723 RepID=A0A830BZL3_9LAMI|nr:probable protein phosphatase 2c 25 [Phtheirospermum japonicum]
MEDRYAAVLGSQGNSEQAFFGVFDGHGGAGAAEYAANNLEKNIMNEVLKVSEEGIEEAVKDGYLKTDSDFLSQDIWGGACCVSALIQKGDLVVSNAGDCRAVMSQGGVAEALTVDHRPSLDGEKERVECLGGYVDCTRGTWRVGGVLAVSRAFGDRLLKQYVVADPEIQVCNFSGPLVIVIFAAITQVSTLLVCYCYKSSDPVHGPTRNTSFIEAVKFYLGRFVFHFSGVF